MKRLSCYEYCLEVVLDKEDLMLRNCLEVVVEEEVVMLRSGLECSAHRHTECSMINC